MEEAWELAAVSEGNDFLERTYAVERNFYLASLISMALSFFNLEDDASVFGFKFSGNNEIPLEIASLTIAVCLWLNFFLRYKSELLKLETIEASISTLKNTLESKISEVREVQSAAANWFEMNNPAEQVLAPIVNALSDLPGDLKRNEVEARKALSRCRMPYEKWDEVRDSSKEEEIASWAVSITRPHRKLFDRANKNTLQKVEIISSSLQRSIDEFHKVDEKISELDAKTLSVASSFVEFKQSLGKVGEALDELKIGIVQQRNFVGYDKVRIFIFNSVFPWIVLTAVGFFFVFESEALHELRNYFSRLLYPYYSVLN
ncbi:hypothetical protein [Algimonas ampicilliniresistens]|uniref:hypothetical protein n=1 Tax=Algimonas ampicilliniresistens TaxID=1298735 RepID=UPI0024E0CB84|nr:hypothetical protein [Algimonas ampicilliniresistens]